MSPTFILKPPFCFIFAAF